MKNYVQQLSMNTGYFIDGAMLFCAPICAEGIWLVLKHIPSGGIWGGRGCIFRLAESGVVVNAYSVWRNLGWSWIHIPSGGIWGGRGCIFLLAESGVVVGQYLIHTKIKNF